MKLAKVKRADGSVDVVQDCGDSVLPMDLTQVDACHSLADILHSEDPVGLAKFLLRPETSPIRSADVTFLAPIDQQEIWAAGVTYQRSQMARMEESETGASHYDRVYTAERPELFFKATVSRVSGPGEPVRVRSDSNWSVPEPEFTLVINPSGKITGYTVGNDMSARDIEGENPLYLPQAKMYRQCAAVGPSVLLADGSLDLAATRIMLTINRSGSVLFSGQTDLSQMARQFEDLASWLFRENDFLQGVLMMTGTGIVPPDDMTLEDGDEVSIEITGVGTLSNPVVK